MLGATRDTGKVPDESATAPAVAVTLTLPAGPLTSLWLVKVMVLFVCPGRLSVGGLNDAWSSTGTPLALRATVPVNPDGALIVTGTLSVEQGGTLSVVGAKTVNNGCTSTCTVVERGTGPTEAPAGVAVIVIYGYVPDPNGGALGPAL